MFERYLSDALTTYFGGFVENLDADRVRLSAWKGELVLRDLQIRPNALDSLVGSDCPVEISYGKIGNLELHIPWKTVRSQLRWSYETPTTTNLECSVILSDLHILITPRRTKQTSDTEDEQLSLEEKRVQKEHDVQRLLDAHLFERVAKSSTVQQQQSSRWQWARQLVANLLSNLSVTIRNIHVRYEDAGMGFTGQQPRRIIRESFSVGVTLRQFSVQTMDPVEKQEEEEEKVVAPVERSFSMRQKLAAAYQLAVYWDRGRGCHLMISNVHNAGEDILQVDSNDFMGSQRKRAKEQRYFECAFAVLNGGDSDDDFCHSHLYDTEHSYVLSPVSPSMEISLVSDNHVKKDDDETDSRDVSSGPLAPPSSFDMSVPPCRLTISATTLEDTAYLRKSLAIWNRTRKSSISEASVRRLTGLRPSASVLEDPQSWWKYAMEATLVLEGRDFSKSKYRRKHGWLGLAQAIKRRRDYVGLYGKVLCAEDELEREKAHRDLIQLEDDLLAEEIVAFRLAVYSMISARSLEPTVGEAAPNSSTWTMWVRGKKGDPAKADLQPVVSETFSDGDQVHLEDMGIQQLSLDHRRRMYSEMTGMLEREKDNQRLESSFRKSIAVGSTSSAVRNEELSSNIIVWKTYMAFEELSLQINERVVSERYGYQQRPVVRLSCAVIQRQTLYRNDAWEVDSAIASLQVVDLTGGLSPSPGRTFPVLVGRKLDPTSTDIESTNDDDNDDSVIIDSVVHPLSVSVSVRRTIERDINNAENRMNRETTYSVVRLLPLEVVYSTNPVAALTRALSTAKTPELTDDYHRMASVMSEWRNRQKNRFLQALAHTRKKIVVDVDVAAPVILIPENPNKEDSLLLVIDLGRLRLSNADENIEGVMDFDNTWKLALNEIQVQCSSTATYRIERGINSTRRSGMEVGTLRAQKLVEPFSLHFIISTRIANETPHALASNGTIVNVDATLPRLVFNLTSSAVRLVERLKLQWLQRAQAAPKGSVESRSIQPGRERAIGTHTPSLISARQQMSTSIDETGSVSRKIKFSFSAPLIGFRLENDVDGRGCSSEPGSACSSPGHRRRSCPLVDLALRGIHGEFIQTVANATNMTNAFDARLRSVAAVDLYQNAGEDFALLLSSFQPSAFVGQLSTVLSERTPEEMEGVPVEQETNDLVSIKYVSSRASICLGHSPSTSKEVHLKDTFAIRFHELYVEWNPETIAAIHKGMMLPKEAESVDAIEFKGGVKAGQSEYEHKPKDIDRDEQEEESDDEFYDAVEAVDGRDSFSISPVRDGEEGDMQSISEVSSCASSFSAQTELETETASGFGGMVNPSSPFLYAGKALQLTGGRLNPLSSFLTPPRPAHNDTADGVGSGGKIFTTKSFEVTFKLSALRANFNKDSRHRRVLTAEMEDTDILYMVEQSGMSKTKARIGNLSFTDPSSTANTTLYKEILGLKSDSFGISLTKATSLLEMDVCINPRTRRIVPFDEYGNDGNAAEGVSIDCCTGTVCGADISVSLRLSPMRFVYLQQLWLEITDYFFEAIVGYEVWGKVRPLFDSELSKAKPSDDHQHGQSRFQSTGLESNLPGILAEEFSFTRFQVLMDEPMILIPVSYQSPHFLRLDFSSLTASNYYLGRVVRESSTVENKTSPSGERVQWYNNCDMDLSDLRLTSWEGAEISCSRAKSTYPKATEARIRINWPVGKWAGSVVPKWKVDCDIDRMALSLHRENYALLQHILVHNIGELSRHLDEWDALQNLPPSELEHYKSEIMVHFGYDKKDTAPTTYAITLNVPSIKFFLLGPSTAIDDLVMEADCTLVEWHMRKLLDRISRQHVTCDIALTKPEGRGSGETGVVDLLLPVEDAAGSDHGADTETRELMYTSTTQPSGDNVRTLEIVNACIFAIYPAWMIVKQFFSALPEPDFMEADEVGLAMQIGDRWYRIGGSRSTKASLSSSERAFTTEEKTRGSKIAIQPLPPSYQFRLLLKSPRIVLPSESMSMENKCVVLRMDHFDFFHCNDALSRKITKAFFVHDLELYTSSSAALNRHGYVDENSLIRPWCVTGQYERCNAQISGPCNERGMHVRADILQARTAYSDMSVAIDVGLRFLSDLQQESRSRMNSRIDDASNAVEEKRHFHSDEDKSEHTAMTPCKVPQRSLLAMELDGFELLVIDDSKRHFAEAQKLVKLSLSEMSCYQVIHQQDDEEDKRKKRAKLSLHRINIFDCLQPIQSPFRLVATSQGPRNETGIHQTVSEAEASDMALQQRMSWLDFHTVEDSRWGFRISQLLTKSVQSQGLADFQHTDFFDSSQGDDSAQGDQLKSRDFVELHHLSIDGVSDEYVGKLRSLTMQWNPSTVIALQRFLGRLHKEAKMKSEREWVIPPSSSSSKSGLDSLTGSDAVPTRARFRIEHLTMFLNKEHQNRHLVRVTLSDNQVHFQHDASSGMIVEGSIRDFSAWDTDTYTERGPKAILEENRWILCVMTSNIPSQGMKGDVFGDSEFLRFRFNTFAGSGPLSSSDSLPSWVNSRLEGLGTSRSAIDDFLSVSIATLRFCFIRERTEEILDYLSNGLPGKGMGATSRAAKGFINKRIQTRSYLELNIQAPQVYVPQNEGSSRGISVRLGDVNARSWFEEANAPDKAERVDETRSPQTVWYRVLSLSLTGLHWNAQEKNSLIVKESRSADVVPLDVNLNLRKPTKSGNAVVITGDLSCIDFTLTYSTYVLLKAVMRDNISRDIDVARWDNVEKAYGMEEDDGDQPAYSSNARFIRYGQERKQKRIATEPGKGPAISRDRSQDATPATPKLECLFSLEGLRLKLHRNDRLEGLETLSSKGSDFDSAFCYDIVVLRADSIEISVNVTSAGDKSLQLSLRRLGVFDLGDGGRLARARYYQTLMELDSSSEAIKMNFQANRNPCAFSVLVEGYSPSEDQVGTHDSEGRTPEEPQLLLTVDICSASSSGIAREDSISSKDDNNDKIVLARMVFNYLSVNALIRPLREILAFLTCSWPLHDTGGGISNGEVVHELDGNMGRSVDKLEESAKLVSFRKGLQLKVVAHYPRIFFLADESDPCSRALVLRG